MQEGARPRRAPSLTGICSRSDRAAAVDLATGVAVRAAALVDPQVVLHVADAREAVDEVFRAALLPAARHRAVESDLGIAHGHLDLARVDAPVVGQAFAGVLANAIVGPRVADGTAAPVGLAAAVVVLVAEPARDRVARALEESALVAAAPTPVVVAPLAAVRRQPAAGAVTARAPGAAAVGRAAVGALAAKGRPLMAVSAGAAREVAAAEVVAGKAREFAASPGRVACGAISRGPVVLGTVTVGVAVVGLPRRLLLVVVAPALAHLARAALVVVRLELL